VSYRMETGLCWCAGSTPVVMHCLFLQTAKDLRPPQAATAMVPSSMVMMA